MLIEININLPSFHPQLMSQFSHLLVHFYNSLLLIFMLIYSLFSFYLQFSINIHSSLFNKRSKAYSIFCLLTNPSSSLLQFSRLTLFFFFFLLYLALLSILLFLLFKFFPPLLNLLFHLYLLI